MPRTSVRTPARLDELELPPLRRGAGNAPLKKRAARSPRASVASKPIPSDSRLPGLFAPTRTPSPFRKHARDTGAITLFALGVVVLLSLYFRAGSLGLGAYLQALLGWGAPAAGLVLMLLGAIIAAGPGKLAGPEVRAGVVMLLAGFLTFAGLLNNHTRGALGDGGDIGNHAAAALLKLLDEVVGDRAAYSCSQVLVAAFNLVGFVMATDKPLLHWARLGQRIGQGVRARLPRRKEAVDPFAAGLLDPPAVSDTSRTRRSKRGAVSAADSDPGQSPPPRAPIPSLTFDNVSPLSSGALEPAGDPPGLPARIDSGGVQRPTVIHGDETTPPRPSRRKVKESLSNAFEMLLPPALPEETELDDLFGEGRPGEPPAEPDDSLAALFPVSKPGDGVGLAGSPDVEPPGLDEPADDEAADDLEAFPPRERLAGPPGDTEPRSAVSPAPVRRRGTATGLALPPSSLLNSTPPPARKTADEAQATVMTLERTLQEFKVDARVVEIAEGPTLTRYEIQLAPGILVKKILSLADNIAMALAAIDVRVEAPIPGKSAIGVEIPKRTPGVVGLRELVETPEFRNATRLTFALGRDVTGAPQYADLSRMPHLLIAGSTGSGKSACLNTLITSILFRARPDEVQFLMIDPKRVELSLYDGIPHLCHQIVRDSKRAPQALGRAMAEMDRRYLLLQEARSREITGYNAKMDDPARKLPYIVIVIDELADLMMTSGAETEHAITRIAQLARAVGIHLVVATQRPSVDIVTGKIKANISSRIAFAVSSGIDSRTILDCNGAERLIGRGDMLFTPIDASKPRRIQGAYISEQELEEVVEFWRSKDRPDFYLERTPVPTAEPQPGGDAADELYAEGVRVVLAAGQASTSMLQRRLKIGYNRAATLIELMEQFGVVGPQDGVRPREVLISREQWELGQEE